MHCRPQGILHNAIRGGQGRSRDQPRIETKGMVDALAQQQPREVSRLRDGRGHNELADAIGQRSRPRCALHSRLHPDLRHRDLDLHGPLHRSSQELEAASCAR